MGRRKLEVINPQGGDRGAGAVDLFGCSEPSPRSSITDLGMTLFPTHKFARFEPSYLHLHISMALQTVGDLFFLICCIPGFLIKIKVYLLIFRMNSLNIIVDFSTYMYFRELRIWHGITGFPLHKTSGSSRIRGM